MQIAGAVKEIIQQSFIHTISHMHVEMLGDRQLFLEGHSGILSYGTEQIDVGAGSLILRVRGQNLTLRSMTDSEVRIFGKIDAVEYVR